MRLEVRLGTSYDDNVNNDGDHDDSTSNLYEDRDTMLVLCSPSEHDEDDADEDDSDIDIDIDDSDRAQYKDDYTGGNVNRQTTGNCNDASSDYFQCSFKRKYGKNEYDLQLQLQPLALQGSLIDDKEVTDPWREKEQQDQE
jgi:hypothetical protein